MTKCFNIVTVMAMWEISCSTSKKLCFFGFVQFWKLYWFSKRLKFNIVQVLTTYNTLIGALILAGRDHFTIGNGYGAEEETVRNMMKLVDPKLDFFLNFNRLPQSGQAKFERLLSGACVPQYRHNIEAYLGESGESSEFVCILVFPFVGAF